MYKRSTEVIVGVFVLIGVSCMIYLSVSLGDVHIFGSPYYKITAEFESVTGLKKGATVEIGGVQMGKVLDISLADDMARVTLGILKDSELTATSSSSSPRVRRTKCSSRVMNWWRPNRP
jgi:phospholipid/cholesterol/gamma-HCH transport system substrate-binding protein